MSHRKKKLKRLERADVRNLGACIVAMQDALARVSDATRRMYAKAISEREIVQHSPSWMVAGLISRGVVSSPEGVEEILAVVPRMQEAEADGHALMREMMAAYQYCVSGDCAMEKAIR